MGDSLPAINVDQLTHSVNTAIHGNLPPSLPPPPYVSAASGARGVGMCEGSTANRGRLVPVSMSGVSCLSGLNGVLPVFSQSLLSPQRSVSGSTIASSVSVTNCVISAPMTRRHPSTSTSTVITVSTTTTTTTTTITTLCPVLTTRGTTVRVSSSNAGPLGTPSQPLPLGVRINNSVVSLLTLSQPLPLSVVTNSGFGPRLALPQSGPVSVGTNHSGVARTTVCQPVGVTMPSTAPILIMFTVQVPVPETTKGQGDTQEMVTSSSSSSTSLPGPRLPSLPPIPFILPMLPPSQDLRHQAPVAPVSAPAASALPLPPVSLPLPPLPLRLPLSLVPVNPQASAAMQSELPLPPVLLQSPVRISGGVSIPPFPPSLSSSVNRFPCPPAPSSVFPTISERQSAPTFPPCLPQSFAAVQSGLSLTSLPVSSLPLATVQSSLPLLSVSASSVPLTAVQSGLPIMSSPMSTPCLVTVQGGLSLMSVSAGSLPLTVVQSGLPLMSVSSLPLPAVHSGLTLTPVPTSSVPLPVLLPRPPLSLCEGATGMDGVQSKATLTQSVSMSTVTCSQTVPLPCVSAGVGGFPSPAFPPPGFPPFPPLPSSLSMTQQFPVLPPLPGPPTTSMLEVTFLPPLPAQPCCMSGVSFLPPPSVPPHPQGMREGDVSLPLSLPPSSAFSLSSGSGHMTSQVSGSVCVAAQSPSVSSFPPHSLSSSVFIPPAPSRLVPDCSSSSVEYGGVVCETESESEAGKSPAADDDDASDSSGSPQEMVISAEEVSVSESGEDQAVSTLVSSVNEVDMAAAAARVEGVIPSSPSSSVSSQSCAVQSDSARLRSSFSTVPVGVGQVGHQVCRSSHLTSGLCSFTAAHSSLHSLPCTRLFLSTVGSTSCIHSCQAYPPVEQLPSNSCTFVSAGMPGAMHRSDSGLADLPAGPSALPQDKTTVPLIDSSPGSYVSRITSSEDLTFMRRSDLLDARSSVYSSSLVAGLTAHPAGKTLSHVSPVEISEDVPSSDKTLMHSFQEIKRKTLPGSPTACEGEEAGDKPVFHYLKPVARNITVHPPHAPPLFYASMSQMNLDMASLHCAATDGQTSFRQCLPSCAMEAQKASSQGNHCQTISHNGSVIMEASQGSFHQAYSSFENMQHCTAVGQVSTGTAQLTKLPATSSVHGAPFCQFSSKETDHLAKLTPLSFAQMIDSCQFTSRSAKDLPKFPSASSSHVVHSCQFSVRETGNLTKLPPESSISIADSCQFDGSLNDFPFTSSSNASSSDFNLTSSSACTSDYHLTSSSAPTSDYHMTSTSAPTISVEPSSQTLLPSVGYSPPGLSNQGLSPHLFSPLGLGGLDQQLPASTREDGSALPGGGCEDECDGGAGGLSGVSASVLDMLLLKADLSSVDKSSGDVTTATSQTPGGSVPLGTGSRDSCSTVGNHTGPAEAVALRQGESSSIVREGRELEMADVPTSVAGFPNGSADAASSRDILVPVFSGQFCLECNKVCREECTHGMTRYRQVRDTPVLTRARATLPDGLYLANSSVKGHCNATGVFAKTALSIRTEFGPLEGTVLPSTDSSDRASFSQWKVFYQGAVKVVDVSDENTSNWLMFLKPARNALERNLLAFQQGHNLVFITTKDIYPDLELLFWFAPDYCRMIMGTPRPPQFCPNCLLCSHVFFHRSELRAHSKEAHSHAPVKKWVCSVCCMQFRSPVKLKEHEMSQHMKVKPYVCPTCGKEFSNLPNLNTHRNIHTGLKRFGCDLCGRHFTQKAHLQSHHATHTKVKAVQCRFCSKRFVRASDMRQHELTHTQEKTLSCQQCSKTFQRPKLLRRHMRTVHNNERNYMCERCSKTFHTKYKLSRHGQSCRNAQTVPACSSALSSQPSPSVVTDSQAVPSRRSSRVSARSSGFVAAASVPGFTGPNSDAVLLGGMEKGLMVVSGTSGFVGSGAFPGGTTMNTHVTPAVNTHSVPAINTNVIPALNTHTDPAHGSGISVISSAPSTFVEPRSSAVITVSTCAVHTLGSVNTLIPSRTLDLPVPGSA